MRYLIFIYITLAGALPVMAAENVTMEVYTLSDPPLLGKTAAGQELRVGGFSGLIFEGKDPRTGRLRFLTHTDRGPNGQPFSLPPAPGTDQAREGRPFALPDFKVQWIRLELDPSRKTIQVRKINQL